MKDSDAMTVTTQTMCCPTCRAWQEWSDTCRRCRGDLRLLRALDQEYQAQRAACLRQFHAGHSDAALDHARQCVQMRDDEAARRLLAVCALFHGDYSTALAAAR